MNGNLFFWCSIIFYHNKPENRCTSSLRNTGSWLSLVMASHSRKSECVNLLNELSPFFFFLLKTFKCRIARVFACFEESQAQMCRAVTCGVQAVTGNWTCLRQVATCLGELRITSVLAKAGNSICTWQQLRDVLNFLYPVFSGVLERPSRTPAYFGS